MALPSSSSNTFLASIPPPPPPTTIPIASSPTTPPVNILIQTPNTVINTVPNSSTPSSSLRSISSTAAENPSTFASTSSSSNNNLSNNPNTSITTTIPTSPTNNTNIPNDDDNKITINKREMRLGLRHRDSFAVHKNHLHQNPHGAHSSVNSMTSTVSITAPTMTRNASDPSLRSHQSSMSQLFANMPPSPSGVTTNSNSNDIDINDILGNDLDLNNGNEEGGPDNDDDDNTEVTIDPSNESDVLQVLESMALNSPEQQAMLKAMKEATTSDPNSTLTPEEEQIRKKNKLKSVIKGVGSYLGLRKSKKKRLAEAAQAAALAASTTNGTPSSSSTSTTATSTVPPSPSSSSSSDSNLLKRLLFRSKSSPSLQNDDERLRDPTSPLPSLHTPPSHHHHSHHHSSSSSSHYTGPNRDEYGMYLPNHRRDTPARSIVKSPNNVRRNIDGSNASTNPNGKSEKRRIAFIDIAYGEPLEQVRFCDDLHYSENSQHIDWDEEDDAGKCVIM